MSIDYSRDYIRQALLSNEIPAPEKHHANGTYEALMGIFMAHSVGGVQGAAAAWESLKKLRPELSEFDKAPLLIHADELKNLSMPTYLLGQYPIYHKAFNVLVGKSGSGKSFVALDIAGRIAADAVCVYIAGEGTSGYAARWESWKSFHQLHQAELYFYTEALQVLDEGQILNFFGMLEERGKKPTLIIIDTMARSAVGLDENSAKEVGEFIAAVDRFKTALDCAALVVHHTGKSGDMRGSTALYGAADSVLSQSLNEGVVRLTNNPDFGGKNKYAPAEFDDFYRIIPHSAGGFDGGVLVPTERIESNPSEDKITKYQEEILRSLDGYEEGLPVKAIQEATEIKQSTIYYNLKLLKKAEYVEYRNDHYIITEAGQDALGGEK